MIKIAHLFKLRGKDLDRLIDRNPPMPFEKGRIFDSEVASIIKKVKKGGDRAVQQYNLKWSKTKATPLVYTEEDFVRALSRVPGKIRDAISGASREIRSFHKRLIRKNIKYKVRGSELGIRYIPHENVAVYVPGGKALYPSTVLMGVIPAKLAGVKNILVLSPPGPDGRVNDYVLAASALVEVNSLYATGGAQAVAAAVYGTNSIRPVSMVAGPGNNYVMRAKWQLSVEEKITIDSPAGPSEVLIIAERALPAKWLAADLLSQAEHGEDSPCLLITPDEEFARHIQEELKIRLSEKTRRNQIKKKAIQGQGMILICKDLDEAIDFSNLYAPEHLQIITYRDKYVLDRIINAGSVFVGPFSPVAAGDYASGTNHILPTGGMAGLYSGLSVETFYKSFTYQNLSKKRLSDIAPIISTLSEVEGLDEEHGRSVDIRLR